MLLISTNGRAALSVLGLQQGGLPVSLPIFTGIRHCCSNWILRPPACAGHLALYCLDFPPVQISKKFARVIILLPRPIYYTAKAFFLQLSQQLLFVIPLQSGLPIKLRTNQAIWTLLQLLELLPTDLNQLPFS